MIAPYEGADRLRGRGRRGGGRREKRGRKKGREGERGNFCAREAPLQKGGGRQGGGGLPPCPPPPLLSVRRNDLHLPLYSSLFKLKFYYACGITNEIKDKNWILGCLKYIIMFVNMQYYFAYLKSAD